MQVANWILWNWHGAEELSEHLKIWRIRISQIFWAVAVQAHREHYSKHCSSVWKDIFLVCYPDIDIKMRLSALEPFVPWGFCDYGIFSSFYQCRWNEANAPVQLWFKAPIWDDDFEAALDVARHSSRQCAQIIDINMDKPCDSKPAMVAVCLIYCTEPDISRVPIMIIHPNWSNLKRVKCVSRAKRLLTQLVLKEAKPLFLAQAKKINVTVPRSGYGVDEAVQAITQSAVSSKYVNAA